MRISDWSSDVCSSDLGAVEVRLQGHQVDRGNQVRREDARNRLARPAAVGIQLLQQRQPERRPPALEPEDRTPHRRQGQQAVRRSHRRSEEHTSELQSLMRISYAVFCLKKKKTQTYTTQT